MEETNIWLKFGLIKSYNIDEKFYKEHKELCDNFSTIYDKIFEKDCSMYGAMKSNKDNSTLKIELCNLLYDFFDLGIKIYNGFDNERYTTKESIREYILEYGE